MSVTVCVRVTLLLLWPWEQDGLTGTESTCGACSRSAVSMVGLEVAARFGVTSVPVDLGARQGFDKRSHFGPSDQALSSISCCLAMD